MARNLELARLFYTIEANTAGFKRDLEGSERQLGRISDFIVKNPVVALGALGTAAIAAGVKAVQMAADFEQSMAEVGTLVDTTTVDMRQLSEGVLGLFRSLPVQSLDDLTRGLYNVISAGVPAAKAIDFLRVATEASVGGVTDVNTAVDGLTSAVNAFASQGLTARGAADAFFVAVKAGKTTFAEISAGIGQTASLAASLGISLDDLLANMVALTKGGLSTAQSFTSLRAIFSNILKPTAEFREQFPGLAREFDIAALRTKGLTQFMVDLAARLQGNTEAASKMFGSVEGLNAALALTANGGASVRDVMDQMANKAGASEEAFAKMAGTNQNLNQILKNQLTAAFVDFGNNALPLVNAGLRAMLQLVQEINGFFDVMSMKEKDFGIGQAELDNIKRVLQTPLFGGKPIDLENLKAGSAEFRAMTSAVISLGSAFAAGVDPAVLGTTEQLKKMRESVLAYGRAHVRALSGPEAETTAQRYLDILKTIDDAIAGAIGDKPTSGGTPGSTGLKGLTKEQKEAAKVAERMAEDYRQAMGKVRQAVIGASRTLTDDLGAAIDDLATDLQRSGVSAADAARALRPLQDELARVKVQEDLRLPEILAKSVEKLTQLDVQNLRSAQAQLQALFNTAEQGSKEQVALGQLIAQVQAKVAALGQKIAEDQTTIAVKAFDWKQALKDAGFEVGNLAQNVPKIGDDSAEIARKVRDIASGALGVAQAFGLADTNTARVLQNIINIGASLPKALSGDVTAIVNVIGNLAGVIGSLFGDSPLTKARTELLRKNNEALDALVSSNGQLLKINRAGSDLVGARAALLDTLTRNTDLRRQSRGTRGLDFFTDLTATLAKQGLRVRDLEAIASDLGITLRGPTGNLEASALQLLLQSLDEVIAKFSDFSDSFGDQMERISIGLRLGTIAAADEFGEIAKVLTGQRGSPAIARALEGLDVTTAEGRAAGAEALRNLFRNIGALGPDQFGGLSQRQFIDTLDRLIKLLTGEEAINPFTATPVGPVPDRPPLDFAPPATASFFADSLSVSERQLEVLEGILANTASFVPVPPPNLPPLTGPSPATGQGAIQIVFEQGAITVQSTGDARADGQEVGRAIIDELLGARLLEARMARGDTRREIR